MDGWLALCIQMHNYTLVVRVGNLYLEFHDLTTIPESLKQ